MKDKIALQTANPHWREMIDVNLLSAMQPQEIAGAIVVSIRQPPDVTVRESWLAPTAALR